MFNQGNLTFVQDRQEEGSVACYLPGQPKTKVKNKVLKMFKKPCWKERRETQGDEETPHRTDKHSKNSRSSGRYNSACVSCPNLSLWTDCELLLVNALNYRGHVT